MKRASKDVANVADPLFLSWDDFERAVERLAHLIRREGPLEEAVIYGQPRGGLPLAVALSHRLQVPLITALAPVCCRRFIWVDDIVDSGETYAAARKQLENFGIVNVTPFVWIIKTKYAEQSVVGEVCAADVVVRAHWVVFPWERRELDAVAMAVSSYRQKRKEEASHEFHD